MNSDGAERGFRNDIPPETLLDDAVRLARVAGAADVRVTLEVWPDMIHAWHQSLWRTKIQNFYLFCDLGYCEDQSYMPYVV